MAYKFPHKLSDDSSSLKTDLGEGCPGGLGTTYISPEAIGANAWMQYL